MHRIRQLLLSTLVVAIVASSGGLDIHRSAAQTIVSEEIAAADRAIVQLLAKHFGGRPPIVDRALADLGFDAERHSNVRADQFRQWPELRKLEQAYRAAHAEGGDAAGQRLLRGMARYIAVEHANSIRYEKGLAQFFPDARDLPIQLEPNQLSFKRPAGAAATAAVSEGVRTVVQALNRYVSPVPGGVPSLLAACCAVPEAETYRLLSTSDTRLEAILKAIQTSRIPAELRDRLARAVQHVAERNHSFLYERVAASAAGDLRGLFDIETSPRAAAEVDVEIEKMARQVADEALQSRNLSAAAERLAAEAEMTSTSNPDRDAAAKDNRRVFGALVSGSRDAPDGGVAGAQGIGPSDPSGGSPAPGGATATPGGPASVTPGAGASGASKSGSPVVGPGGPKPGPGGLAFAQMVGPKGRFGGVVFGNTVETPGDFRVRDVSWVPSGSSESGRRFGRFEFVSTTGRVGFSATIAEDLAAAAVVLVLDGVDGILPPIDPVDGDAAPLAGIVDDGAIAWPRFEKETGRIEMTTAERFAVNPAINGHRLGYSAVLADAIPFMMTNLLGRMRDAGESESELSKVKAWQDRRSGFYKITDAPLQICVGDDGYVDVVGNPPTAQPEQLRTVALLSMQIPEWDGGSEFSMEFYAAVPALTRVFPPFSDLNAFAEAFALVRWAKRENAAWSARPPLSQAGPRLHAVKTSSQGLVLGSETEAMTWLEIALRQADAHAAELAAGAAGAEQANRELANMRRQAIAQIVAARRIAGLTSDSEDEREKLEGAASALLEQAYATRLAASETLDAMIARGAGFVPEAQKSEQDALVEKSKELRYELWEVEGQRNALNDAEPRLEIAADSVKAVAGPLLNEFRRQVGAYFERVRDMSDEEARQKWAAIEALNARLNVLLPVDAAAANRLDQRVTELQTALDNQQSALKALRDSPPFRRLAAWTRLQRSSQWAVNRVGLY